MKATLLATIAVAIAVTASAQSKDPMAAAWKLNVAKSHYTPGPGPKGQTTTFHFDGKEYELKGAAVKTFRWYKRTGDRRIEWTNREDGKITTTTVTEVSADGKTRTLTTTGHDLKGREVHNVALYDRE